MEHEIHVGPGDALLIVDVQRDFLPGGALAVPEGDDVIAPLNDCIALFSEKGLPIVATRDWHPPDHCSFVDQGGPWPPHCVQQTEGAAFAPALQLPEHALIISKASRSDVEAYSGFEGTELAEMLRHQGVQRIFVGGLATDYCVRATVLDALREGFAVVVLTDAIRAVDAQKEDRALNDMSEAGALPAGSDQLA